MPAFDAIAQCEEYQPKQRCDAIDSPSLALTKHTHVTALTERDATQKSYSGRFDFLMTDEFVQAELAEFGRPGDTHRLQLEHGSCKCLYYSRSPVC